MKAFMLYDCISGGYDYDESEIPVAYFVDEKRARRAMTLIKELRILKYLKADVRRKRSTMYKKKWDLGFEVQIKEIFIR